ncbi:hypothetical protein V2J09_012149 [Rumex salicifolius]
MLAAQSPITPLTANRRPNTASRTPLQPKNTPSNRSVNELHSKPKLNPDEALLMSKIGNMNKENNPAYAPPSPPSAVAKVDVIPQPSKVEVEITSIDGSLAEELNAVRKRMERMRLDRENTEKMLMERDRIFEIQMDELRLRGEFQKELEIEVDRLYRLKQLHLHSTRTSPIRSLRERELQRRLKESPSLSQSQISLTNDESVDKSVTTTLIFSSESTSDVSSAIRAVDC